MKKSKPVLRPDIELERSLTRLGHRHSLDTVFNDWVACMALSIANAVDLRPEIRARREAEYMLIVRRYERDIDVIKEVFPRMFGLLVQQLEVTRECVFGPLLTKLELAALRTRARQVFTPYALAYAMARMTIGSKEDIERQLAESTQGHLTLLEPACGAGVMILAAANLFADEGVNYQKCLHVTAVDTDIRCVHMTYIQSSLLGIPACIVHGNSLSLQEWSHWYTPMHILDGWNARLAGKSPDHNKSVGILQALRLMAEIAIQQDGQEPAAAAQDETFGTPEAPASTVQVPLIIGDWPLHIDQTATSPPMDPT